MTVPHPSDAELSAAISTAVPDPSKKLDGWNQKTISIKSQQQPQQQQQQQQQHHGSIGWADRGNEQRQGQFPAERIGAGQATLEQIQIQGQAQSQIDEVTTATMANTSSTSGRYENQCRLEESVTPSTLLAHLRLLRLVQSLVIIDDEDLDFLFLIRSEERYLMYLDLLQQLQPPANAVPLPPLDVALMWTVHMLAPFRYHEDLLRSYGPHLLGYAFPLERYVAAVDIEDPSTDHEAFTPSKQMWRQMYPEEAFDLDKMDTDRMFEIQCLWCGGTNVMDSSTYIKFRIDGMAIDCAGCGSQCSLETLSSKRLWDGIEAYRADPNILLAGSLLSPWTGTPDAVLAQKEHHHLFFHPRIQFALDQASASLNCTWANVGEAFRDLGPDQYYGVRPTTLARITSSYTGLVEDRLSMDLVAGALRQRDFQKAMMVTGGQAWCQPQVLQRTLERYKKFMLLARAESKHMRSQGGGGVAGLAMAAGGGNLGAGQPGRHALVPTLDIDLAWHTHMLSPEHYRRYQLAHYGRVLNHDDTVQATSTMTKQDFIRTAELWEDLYQERYSSQQTWKDAFVLTPQKLCAGVCFPPYGVYLIWKNWKSKRKAKKLNKPKTGGEKGSSRDKKKKKKKTKGGKDTSSTNEKDSAQNSQRIDSSNSITASGLENLEKPADLTVEDLGIQETPQRQQPDIKGKGKIVNEIGTAEASESGAGASSATVPEVSLDSTGGGNKDGNPIRQQSARNLNPALGLDGRLSNWNGDAAGPDGQASCSSGACIMSPWNELQDLVPYIDLQPPQQRELRRERT
ncbi:hypothetical protein BGX26_005526 [Mortierella sp. AD094]|nr:hypothetical protein BGX26_005526 [Mortierella sp. AD094]